MGWTDSSYTTYNPNVYDPLFDKQAQGVRSDIYSGAASAFPKANEATQNFVNSLNSAYSNPLWQQGQNVTSNALNGTYLTGGKLGRQINAMDAQTGKDAVSQKALLEAQRAQTGMNLSDTERQAIGTAAAAERSSAQDAKAQLKNAMYQQERGMQQAAPAQAAALTQAQANVLAPGASAYWGPLGAYGNLLSNSMGAQLVDPDRPQGKSGLDYLIAGIGSLSGIAGTAAGAVSRLRGNKTNTSMPSSGGGW